MRRFFTVLVLLSAVFMLSCTSNQTKPEVNISTIVSPSDGLDFKLVGALLQDGTVTNAESLERELNKEGGINNLDLNSDGKVDYINVSENKGNATTKGFDLTTGDGDDATFIGAIEIENLNGSYNIHMSGNQEIYGNNANYSTRMSTGDMLFYAWLFSPGRSMYYHRPYHYGYYPSYYHPVVVVPRAAYRTRTVTQSKSVSKSVSKSTSKSKLASANKGKVSKSARKSINDNKKAVKSFKAREKNKVVKKSGFTKGKSTAKSTKSKSKSSIWGRSKSSSSRSSSSRSYSSGRSSSSSSSRRSDVRSKENIKDMPYGLMFVQNMKPKMYNYRVEWVLKENLRPGRQYGFIAQELEKTNPELVITGADGYKSVDYVMVIPILVQGLQDLTAIVKAQQKEIDTLKEVYSEINN